MPVHGEWRHLRAHARLGIESGVAPDRVVLCEDGDVVDLVDGHARLVGPRQEPLRLRGRPRRRRRRRVACSPSGGSSATAASSRPPWWSTRSPARWSAGRRVSAKGFSEDPAAFDPVMPLITEALDRAAAGRHHRPAPAAADRPPDGRPLGQRRVPPPADDRADRGRGLITHPRRRSM